MPLQTALCLTCKNQPKVGVDVTRRHGVAAPAIVAKNAGEVPQWYKRAGIYGALPPVVGSAAINPWKQPLQVGHLVAPNDEIVLPLSALVDLEAEVPTDRPVWFAVWAAAKREFDQVPAEAAPSYGNFSNAGVARSDPETQTLRIQFALPRPYLVDGQLFHPHVHFTRLLADNTWELAAWSVSAPPVLHGQEVAALLRSKQYLGINCLDGSRTVEQQQHIPGTLQLPYSLSLAAIHRRLAEHQLPIRAPLILYCASTTCSVSHIMFHKLMQLGYVNLLLYPGGLADWFRS